MHYNWNTLSFGGKLITVSTIIAIISIFLPWLDMVRFSYNGFQELAVVLLMFYIYPMYKTLKNQTISLPIGVANAVAAAAASVGYMEWKTIPFEGVDLCFAGHGTYIFFFTSVFLLIGILKYRVTPNESIDTDTPQS